MTKEQIKRVRQAEKRLIKIEAEKNQKPVKKITINIEWKKSRTWGRNPHCKAFAIFHDGSEDRSPTFKASGWGYDKESTVIASVFNHYLKYKLYLTPSSSEDPYGIHVKDGAHYDGGIGTRCYYSISSFIGGVFTHVASGEMFDVFMYEDKSEG